MAATQVKVNGHIAIFNDKFEKSSRNNAVNALTGVGYFYPQFTKEATISDVAELYGTNEDGTPGWLGVINADIKNRISLKTRNAVTVKDGEGKVNVVDSEKKIAEKLQALQEVAPNCLNTIEDAETWKPSVREVTLQSQMLKVAKLVSSGDMSREDAKKMLEALLGA